MTDCQKNIQKFVDEAIPEAFPNDPHPVKRDWGMTAAVVAASAATLVLVASLFYAGGVLS